MKKNLVFLMALLLVALAVPQAKAETLTVEEGTVTDNQHFPIYGYYADQNSTTTMVYPSSDLSDITGGEITGITFYYSSVTKDLKTGTLTLSLGEVEGTSLSAHPSGLTPVYSGTPNITTTANSFTITFDEAYNYKGGNLAVHVVVSGGTDGRIYFKGNSQSENTSYLTYGYSSSNLSDEFLPMATFEYESATPVPYKVKVSPESLSFGKLSVGSEKTLDITVKNLGINAITPSLSTLDAPFSTIYTPTEIAKGETAIITVKFNPTEAGDWNKTATLSFGTTELDDVVIPISGNAALEETVYGDNTNTTNTYTPVYGLWYDTNQHNQMIYPEADLASLMGKSIKKITFYAPNGINFYGGNVEIRLSTVDNETFSTDALIEVAGNALGSIVPVQNDKTLSISFADGFLYTGGNLLVDVQTTTYTSGNGYYGTTNFEGIAKANSSIYSYNTTTKRNGYLPTVTFAYEDAAAQVLVTPTELTFGGESFVIGNTEDKTFKVSNTTDEDVTLTLNDESGFYSIAPTTIEAGATSITVTVTYAPTTAGTHDATVTVGDKTVTLNGAAVAPIISGTVTPAELTFETYENVSSTQTITIENTGNTAFTPAFSSIEAPFSIDEAVEIAAGESKDFVVTYAPTAIGTDNGTLTVDINGTTTNIALSGTATEVPPIVTVADDGISMSDSYGYSPIPVEGKYFDEEGTYGQTIYNKSDLGLLAGKNITKVKYYSNTTFDADKIGGTVLEIYLMETEDDEIQVVSYSAQPLTFEGAPLGEYTVKGNEKDVEFELTTPFAYSGDKNLAIQVRVKTASPQTGTRYQAIDWIGEAADKWISCYKYGNSPSRSLTLPKTSFTYEKEDPNCITLAELCKNGVKDNTYTITDELIAVEARDVKVDDEHSDVYVWCKDNNNIPEDEKLAPAAGVIDFMKQHGENGMPSDKDWDQSNWIVLRFKDADRTNDPKELKDYKLTGITGTYADNNNYMIDVKTFTKGDKVESYKPNVYCVANFNPNNWGSAGVQQINDENQAYGPYYFFMTPKVQEVCEITFAAWNGTTFTVPATSGFEKNTLTLGWNYNENGAGTPMDNPQAFGLVVNNEYKFNAIVQRSASKGAITGGSVVYPTNLTGGEDNNVATAINTISVNGEVKSVKYYNVAGIESDVPFEGVNIEVTTYTDGSRTSRKIVK